MVVLALQLGQLTALQYLDLGYLGGNHLRAEGASVLAPALRQLTALHLCRFLTFKVRYLWQ